MRKRSTFNSDELVDGFVKMINSRNRELLFEEQVTPSVAEQCESDTDYWQWSIRHYSVTWIADFESRLPAQLAPSFKSLVNRYIFPPFEAGGLWFFGNTPEGLKFTAHELRCGVFQDQPLSSCLFKNGYIQFARPAGGSYDPICFNVQARNHQGEYLIQRLDHEDVLCNSRIRVVNTVGKSFYEFLKTFMESCGRLTSRFQPTAEKRGG